MITCYTAGVFDLLHLGHLNILRRSKELAGPEGRLVVGVVTDDGAEAYKRRPVQDEITRAAIIAALRFVDVVIMQYGTDPSDNLRKIRPDYMSHGNDWSRLREGHATLEELGVEWVLIPYTEGVSTTEIRERIAGAA